MEVTVREIAALVNGVIEGDADLKINRPSRIEDGGQGSISFFGNPKYESYVYTTDASVLLVHKSFQPKKKILPTLIRVDDVYAAIAVLLEAFGTSVREESNVSERASIDPSARVGSKVSIGDFCVVQGNAVIGEGSVLYPQVYIGKNVKIGKQVILYPGVKILDDCVIGNHCILHSNVVIGSDGFGFAPQADGSYKKIPQLGNVVLEDHIEIGANTSIDRASMGSTVIHEGVKLDNLIQIAHNAEVGAHTVIAAQTGVAGSTKIGRYCQIGGQVGFVGHISVADRTRIQAQSGIASAVKEEGTALFGSPAIPYSDFLRAYSVFKKLPDLYKRVHKLEQQRPNLKPEKD